MSAAPDARDPIATLPLPAPWPDGPLVLALSGGLDSLALLHRLAGEPAVRVRGLRALHVNHGLHPDAARWAAQVQAQAAALQVAVDILPVQVRDAGTGLEAAARAARYAAFAGALRPGETLVLAHHQDDQAETVLQRLLRASGAGLAAMAPLRTHAGHALWRPWLDLPRARIHAAAQAASLQWIDDPANADPRHDRSLLRHAVLPLLRQRWPQAGAALARSAQLLAAQSGLLERMVRQAWAACRSADPHVLRVDALRLQPEPLRAELLRHWIGALGLPPLPASGVAQIEAQLLHARADAEARFAWRDAQVLRWRDLLHADTTHAALAPDWSLPWPADDATPRPLPGGARLGLQQPDGRPCAPPVPLRLRTRQGGERIRLPGRAHQHALRDVFQSLGIPPWERQRLPLLLTPDGAVWAVGDLIASADADDWMARHGVRLVRTSNRAD